MKNIYVLFLFLTSFFYFSCSEDDETTPTEKVDPISTNYRVKGSFASNSEGTESKFEVTYNDENNVTKLTGYVLIEGEWYEYYIAEASYNGNTVEVVYTQTFGGMFIEMYTEKVVIEDGKVISYNYIEDDGVTEYNITELSTYEKGNLTEFSRQQTINGTFEFKTKYIYDYNDSRTEQMRSYLQENEDSNFNLFGIETYSYNNYGMLEKRQLYSVDIEGNQYAFPYRTKMHTYNGDLLTRVYYFESDEYGDMISDYLETTEYVYNENNLLTQTTKISNSTFETETYDYEEGIGNATLLYYTDVYERNLLPVFKSANGNLQTYPIAIISFK